LHLADGNWLFAAFLLFGAAHLLTSKRLQLLLHSRRLDLSLFNTFRLNLYGAFSGLFFLGFVSGDTVKLILIQQHYPKTKYATLACLITDRVLGLFGMIAITALAIGGEYSSIFHNQSLALSLVSVFAWAFGFCASYILLHSIVTNQKTRDLLARKFKRRNQTVEFQLPPRSVTSIGAALAVCTHGLVAFSGYCVMRSLSIPLDFPKAFATLAVTGFCTAFPVSPGGIGVRESCLLILTKTFGYTSNEPVIALSALIFLMQLSWALIGAGLQFGWLRRNEEHISK